MKLISKLKNVSRKGLFLGVMTATVVGAGLFLASHNSVSADSQYTYNCDSNAVVYCGAETSNGSPSAAEITTKYNKGDGHNSATSIHNIYGSKQFNISSSDVQNLAKTAQMGYVTKSGDVYVGNTLVATNAITAGRSWISGSQTASNGGTTYYVRKPSVSFVSNSIPAYVVMVNGQFKFALLTACGNPVIATPVKKPCPPPVYTCDELSADQIDTYDFAFTAKATAQNGAVITGYQFNYGDGNSQTVNSSAGSVTAKHTYAKSNTYNVTVAAIFKVNGATKSVTSKACATSVTVCPQPVYTCDELKADQDSLDEFTFTATATAQNGAVIKGYVFNYGDGNSQTVATGNNSISAQHTYKSANTYKVTVAALIAVNGQTKTVTSANCATTAKVCPPPTAECTNLTSEENTRTEFTFTAKANAQNGAVITGYQFNYGDGSNQTVTSGNSSVSASHTYANPGTYNVTVAALVTMNGQAQTIPSATCATTVKVCPPPAAECTDLKLIQNASNPREVAATVTYTTSNGATLTGVSFNWDDNSTTPASLQTAANHTYQADGTYNVVVTLTFSATTGTVANSTCQAPITITTVVPTCTELDIDVDNTTKTVSVTNVTYTANNGTYEYTTLDWGDGSPVTSAANAVGQSHTYTTDGPFTLVATTHFTVNGADSGVTSPSCQQPVSFTETPTPPSTPPTTPPVTPPTQLVNTGAGNVVGIFLAATIAGVVGYHWFIRRRLSHNS